MNLNTVHKIIAQHFPSTLYRYMKHGKKGNNETDSVNPHLFDHGPHLARNSSKESNATSSTDFCRQTTANSECCVTHCSPSCSPRLLKAAGTSQQQVDSTSLHIMLHCPQRHQAVLLTRALATKGKAFSSRSSVL